MLRPKYVVPIFKGARAVFIAGSTHGATGATSPWPAANDAAPLGGALPAASEAAGASPDDGKDRRAASAVAHSPASQGVPQSAPGAKDVSGATPAQGGSGLLLPPQTLDMPGDTVYPGRGGGRRSPPLGLGPPGPGLRGATPGGGDLQVALGGGTPLFVPVPEQLFRQSTVLPLAATRTLFSGLPATTAPDSPPQGLQTVLLAAQGAGGMHSPSLFSAPVSSHLVTHRPPGWRPPSQAAPPPPTFPVARPKPQDASAARTADCSSSSPGLAPKPLDVVDKAPEVGGPGAPTRSTGQLQSSMQDAPTWQREPRAAPMGMAVGGLPSIAPGTWPGSQAPARHLPSVAGEVAPTLASGDSTRLVADAAASPSALGKVLLPQDSLVPAAGRRPRRQQRERPEVRHVAARHAPVQFPSGGVVYMPKPAAAAALPCSEPPPQAAEQGRRAGRQRPLAQQSGGPLGQRMGPLSGQGANHNPRDPRDARRQGSQGPRPASRALVGDVCQALRKMHWGALDADGSAGWQRDVGAALQRWHGSLNVYNVCDVLKQQHNPQIAMGLFEWTKGQPNYHPDVFVYTTLIGVLGGAREMTLMGAMYEEMKAAGLKPTLVTFNRLLYAYGRNNMLEEALAVCAELRAAGMAPDRVTYGTLIDLFSKAGQHERAVAVFEEMQAAHLQPDAVAYTVLMNSYKRMGDPHKALALYRRMLDEGCEPNIFSYNTVIDLHGKAGRTRLAMTIFQEMRSKGVVPDVMTYSTMIDLCGKGGLYDAAEEMFESMQAAGHVPDTVAWSTLIQMWGRAGDPHRAALYFRRMLRAGLTPSVPAYNALMFAFLRADMFVEAKAAFDTLRRAGQAPSLHTYTLLLSHSITCADQVGTGVLLELMSASGQPVHDLLVKLLQEPAGDERERELQAAVARGLADVAAAEDFESKRSFTDAFIDFLRKYGQEARASMVWTQARQVNIYPYALAHSPSAPEGPWTLNLHYMSSGTACIVTMTELGNLRRLALGPGAGPFPAGTEIITGWGRRSRVQGQSHIKQKVERALDALGSPFQEDAQNIGRLHAPAAAVREWLRQPHLEEGLALHNTPPPPPEQ